MSRVDIDRLSLRLDGIEPETARAAIQGLEAEVLRRLSVRGVDALALRALSPSVRLPAIHASAGLDAETLRASIADGLVALLGVSPSVVATSETDSSNAAPPRGQTEEP